MAHVRATLELSERRVCGTLGVARSTARYRPRVPDDEGALLAELARLKAAHPKWGYKKMTAHLKTLGWKVNHKRVWRIWKAHGWQVPAPMSRRAKAKATGSSSNACDVRRAELGNQVWAVDFVEDRTHEGKKLRILTVLDEYTREGLALQVARSMGSRVVKEVLERLIAERGAPEFVRSDNGKEFAAELVRRALEELGVESAFIAPGSPWQNGKNERFNGILSQEVLGREVWGNVLEAQTVCNQWLGIYNEVRPHGSLEMMTPAAYAQQAMQDGVWFSTPQQGHD